MNGKEDDFSFSATFDCGGNLDQWAIDEQTYRPMISESTVWHLCTHQILFGVVWWFGYC